MRDPVGDLIVEFLRYMKNMGWIRMDVDVFVQRVRNIFFLVLISLIIALLLFNMLNNQFSP